MNNRKILTEELSKDSGITLIALIITIIVLLILSLVTIQSLVGNDSVLEKAQMAKQETENADKLEKIKMAFVDARLEGNGVLTIENLNAKLKGYFGDNEDAIKSGNNYYYKEYIINENGNVEKYNKLLPNQYQQVEYVESTGTQYVNTEIYGITATDEFLLRATYERGSDGCSTMFGWDDEEYYYDINLHHLTKGNVAEVTWGKENFITTAESIERGVPHDTSIKVKNNKLEVTIDNTVLGEIDISTSNQNQAHGLFARFRNNTPRLYAQSKVYQLKYWRNGKLYRNFIPCYTTQIVKDKNGRQCPVGTIGLYELVEGKFYSNEGTGEFVKGTDI